MGSTLLIYVIYLIFGFLAMFLLFMPRVNDYEKTLKLTLSMLPFPYLFLFYALGVVSSYFLSSNYDFIEPLTWVRILAPLVLVWIIYISSIFVSGLFYNLIILVCVGVLVWLQPLGIGTPIAGLSVLETKLIAFAFGGAFCIGAPILNGVPHTFIIPNLAVLIGLSVMSLIGASPIYFAFCSAMFLGALAAYLYHNFYKIKIELDNPTCSAVAFLVFNLLVMNLGEFCFTSCFMLTSVFWIEIGYALWMRYIIAHSGDLSENTHYYLFACNYQSQIVTMSLARISAVIIFLAWFQLFSNNFYSLPIVSLVIAFWLNTSIGQSNKTLKEINKQVVQDFKQNVKDFQDIINKKD